MGKLSQFSGKLPQLIISQREPAQLRELSQFRRKLLHLIPAERKFLQLHKPSQFSRHLSQFIVLEKKSLQVGKKPQFRGKRSERKMRKIELSQSSLLVIGAASLSSQPGWNLLDKLLNNRCIMRYLCQDLPYLLR